MPAPNVDQTIWDMFQSHWDAAVAAIFTGGIAIGVHRGTLRDHEVRIKALEDDAARDIRRLEDKIDANHAAVMTLLVTMAAKPRD